MPTSSSKNFPINKNVLLTRKSIQKVKKIAKRLTADTGRHHGVSTVLRIAVERYLNES